MKTATIKTGLHPGERIEFEMVVDNRGNGYYGVEIREIMDDVVSETIAIGNAREPLLAFHRAWKIYWHHRINQQIDREEELKKEI